MWFSGSQSKTNVEEANRHLSALMDKLSEIEKQLEIKDAELNQKEDDFTNVMQEVHFKRQEETKDLNELIYKQNVKLQRLERDLINKDSELSILRKRCRMFDEVLRYKATLAKLTITLEQAEQYANLTGFAKNYAYSQKELGELVNTEPSPLALTNMSQKNISESELIDEVGQTFISSETKKGTLVHLAMNGHR